MNIQLIGSIHDTGKSIGQIKDVGGTLLNQIADKMFVETYFPVIENCHTLLLVEGSYDKNIVTNENSKYEDCISVISKALLESDLGPDLIGSDTRHRSLKNIGRLIASNYEFKNWLSKNAAISFPQFQDLATVEQNLISRKKDYFVYLAQDPTAVVKSHARRIQTEYKMMEEAMMEKAQFYSRNYDRVLIMAGLSHTLSMARLSGLPHHSLYEINTQTDYKNLYMALLNAMELPEIITTM